MAISKATETFFVKHEKSAGLPQMVGMRIAALHNERLAENWHFTYENSFFETIQQRLIAAIGSIMVNIP